MSTTAESVPPPRNSIEVSGTYKTEHLHGTSRESHKTNTVRDVSEVRTTIVVSVLCCDSGSLTTTPSPVRVGPSTVDSWVTVSAAVGKLNSVEDVLLANLRFGLVCQAASREYPPNNRGIKSGRVADLGSRPRETQLSRSVSTFP